jgi:hypothetical protein
VDLGFSRASLVYEIIYCKKRLELMSERIEKKLDKETTFNLYFI